MRTHNHDVRRLCVRNDGVAARAKADGAWCHEAYVEDVLLRALLVSMVTVICNNHRGSVAVTDGAEQFAEQRAAFGVVGDVLDAKGYECGQIDDEC